MADPITLATPKCLSTFPLPCALLDSTKSVNFLAEAPTWSLKSHLDTNVLYHWQSSNLAQEELDKLHNLDMGPIISILGSDRTPLTNEELSLSGPRMLNHVVQYVS